MRINGGNYKNLVVWQKSMVLVEGIYRTTSKFPVNETYGITSQMRRSAISIPSNIAEGSRRKTLKDIRHFFSLSYGSAAELDTQLEISRRLRYVEDEEFKHLQELLVEVLKMLNKMSHSSD